MEPPRPAGGLEGSLPPNPACLICQGLEGDVELKRTLVWENDLWRLTTTLFSEVPGFSYLEPKRHIPHVTDLDGEEARTFGAVLARAARTLKEVTSAELVFLYVFGGHPTSTCTSRRTLPATP